MALLSPRTVSPVAPPAGWPFAWVLHGPWPPLSSGGRSLHLGCMEESRLACVCVRARALLWCALVKPGQGLPPMGTEQCPIVPCLRFVSRKVPVVVGQRRGAWTTPATWKPTKPMAMAAASAGGQPVLVRPCSWAVSHGERNIYPPLCPSPESR